MTSNIPMSKPLSEMTLEELWQLFPIILTEHRECWSEWYREEEGRLRGFLGEGVRLSHIGSTAVDGIWAKPIIDILAELSPGEDMQRVKDALCKNGYICMSQSKDRMSFNRGYTEIGFAKKVFHLHLRYAGDNDEIYFRDYLNAHPEEAKYYERLKLGLWKTYEYDRDAYTNAKSEFVAELTRKAKMEMQLRY